MVERLKLAVLGTPIAHSRSPELQASFARDLGVADFSYERIETDCESLRSTVQRLIGEGYNGFNCTMPLKTDIAQLADCVSDEARVLSSANTIVIREGKLQAYTTDGEGILLAVRRGFGDFNKSVEECVKGKNVLLLGAGGAARSAALSLKNAGAELAVANRTLESAYALGDMLGAPIRCLPLERKILCDAARGADILINCTAMGMSGKAEFEYLDFVDALPLEAMVIDAVYNPLETALLGKARGRGLSAISGLWMLIYQGAAAFEKWSGIRPDEDACARAFELIK